jgi:hypothetical protein
MRSEMPIYPIRSPGGINAQLIQAVKIIREQETELIIKERYVRELEKEIAHRDRAMMELAEELESVLRCTLIERKERVPMRIKWALEKTEEQDGRSKMALNNE